ncbi:MAG: hypothetical protein DRQ62_00125 [Gammaproteobacteria bacterium]|nr:MAG: hypothetical protein DRQ62_00125 [Gammaproteobacteria bacterium]
MTRWVWDTENDDLLRDVSRNWIIAAYNLDEKKMYHWLEGDFGWIEVFDKATLMIGHNILGYDNPVLEKLFGYTFPKTCKFRDTLLMSQILNYKRFGHAGHGLAKWGEFFNYPKGDFHDWSQYSEEMRDYCFQDVRLTAKVYKYLLEEYKRLVKIAPKMKPYMQAEHAVGLWTGKASLIGWPFDVKAGKDLFVIFEAEMQVAYDALSHKLGTTSVMKDKKFGEVVVKKPKWIKAGCYDAHTANWFDIDPWSGFEGEERPIEGEFCRVEFRPLSLDSVTDVKVFLFRNGWEPDTWNKKYDEGTRQKIQTSPKITESSLEFLGGDGKLYLEFLTTRSRYGILKTWLEVVDENGNLHGEALTIGTPSMRTRHSIIVNVPSGELNDDGSSVSKWGPEMRRLFMSKPGWKLVGCDSAGNQARGLAHYLNDDDFTDTLLNGDIHTYNKDKANDVLEDMGYERVVTRAKAKRILYAFLFGAGGDKLWSYIFNGVMDKKLGNRFKKGFTKAVPGFADLIEKLENIFGKTRNKGNGYIPSLAGNRIYVDSFHKLLVYLLQAAEKITCSAAVMLTMERLEAEGIPYIPLIIMHDEEDFMVPEEHAERAAQIGKQAFVDGPKLFGVEIMDGDSKIGDNWYEIH